MAGQGNGLAVLFAALLWSACGRGPADGQRAARPGRAQEAAAYDRYRRPDLLLVALGLRRGHVVADVGAGQGYLTTRLAAAVGPAGRVVATDLDPEALQVIARTRRALSDAAYAPIETRLVPADEPRLERGRFDLILLSEVDHLLHDRVAYLARLRAALAPGGRIVVSNRRLYREPLLTAAAAAKLVVVAESGVLPAHFLLFFEAGS